MLAIRHNTVESLWIYFRGKANKVDIIVGFYCKSSSQYDDINVLLYMALREISRSIALGLTDDFNLQILTWGYHTSYTNRSREFLKHVENNALIQMLRQ